MTQMTRDKGQLQMLQNPVHNLIFREEGDDSHPPALMEAMSTARRRLRRHERQLQLCLIVTSPCWMIWIARMIGKTLISTFSWLPGFSSNSNVSFSKA